MIMIIKTMTSTADGWFKILNTENKFIVFLRENT